MTDEEYERAKAEIVTQFGKPEYDMNDPVNESARLLSKLRSDRGNAASVNARAKTRLAKLTEEIDTRIHYAVPEIDLSKTDLEPFTELEQKILSTYFRKLTLTNTEIATNCQCSRQQVTALFKSDRFKLLYKKVFDSILPLDALIAIRALIRKGDAKVALEVARHYGLIKSESVDVNLNSSKPIEDPTLVNLLKQLGDSYKGS